MPDGAAQDVLVDQKQSTEGAVRKRRVFGGHHAAHLRGARVTVKPGWDAVTRFAERPRLAVGWLVAANQTRAQVARPRQREYERGQQRDAHRDCERPEECPG